MKYNIVDCIQRGAYSTNNSTAYSTNNSTITIESSISYQVVQNSKSYFQCLHHRLVPGKCFERHCHRSKLNSWYWQNGYIPDTCKVSGVWMSFVQEYTFTKDKIHKTSGKTGPHPPSPFKFTPFCFGGFSSYEDILYFTTRCGLFNEQPWVIIEFRSSQLRPSQMGNQWTDEETNTPCVTFNVFLFDDDDCFYYYEK